MRKATFLAIFLVALIALSGCATVHGFGKGLVKDTKTVWGWMVKAGEWFEEHAW